MKIMINGRPHRMWFQYRSTADVLDILANLGVSFPEDRAGVTTLCYLWDEGHGVESAHVGAAVQSLGDRFSKITGRRVALARCIGKDFSRPERESIWKQYHARKNPQT